jgi:hypothetical protein
MHKLIAVAAAIGALAATTPAVAHPEDESPYANRGPSTSDLARMAVDRLVEQKKLPASWAGAKLSGFDFRTKNGVEQYVVIFENPAIKQVAKRKLYVFMSTTGEFISANHKLI